MQQSEKVTEPFLQVLVRTMITAVVFSSILNLLHVFPTGGKSWITLLEMGWSITFCILFTGHWLELLYVNHIKFLLPPNRFLLYIIRPAYWFVCAIPLTYFANLTYNAFSGGTGHPLRWQVFGLVYIGIQLFMQAQLHFRSKKSFYNGVY